ncbi:hypothetical protein J0S82_007549 [Galemys pyrenaicus]|uniref:Uncharacterized protein n=1 Tax=Galemys pyrenaicus TaxID=202257 RepID=A0A8J6DHG6_GALPY|nr:hypothetical protein J0S82_007549 [Galemys pyrenaicus]
MTQSMFRVSILYMWPSSLFYTTGIRIDSGDIVIHTAHLKGILCHLAVWICLDKTEHCYSFTAITEWAIIYDIKKKRYYLVVELEQEMINEVLYTMIEIIAPPEHEHSMWVGNSILTTLFTSQQI